jgi:RHS repeat-associated protein
MGYEFDYGDGERLPSAMRREDGAVFTLHYDQVGSLRVVADVDGDVIKEILFDPFGGIIEDTIPGFRVPLGFAGGLHDRDMGLVRFGWRDYDTFTGRWTAPDPIGDKGGDPDWYGYCLDDPVNGVDPLGLFTDVFYYDDNLGHVSVAPGGGKAVGKYPKNGKNDAFNGEGEYREEKDTPSASMRLDTTPEQEAFMKEYQRLAKKSTSVKYDLGDDDCVNAADTVLEVGGVKTPKDTVWVRPKDYFERLGKMHK